jgi:hypothetical protein
MNRTRRSRSGWNLRRKSQLHLTFTLCHNGRIKSCGCGKFGYINETRLPTDDPRTVLPTLASRNRIRLFKFYKIPLFGPPLLCLHCPARLVPTDCSNVIGATTWPQVWTFSPCQAPESDTSGYQGFNQVVEGECQIYPQ